MEKQQESISQAAVIGVLAMTIIVIFVISYLSDIFGFIKSLFASPEEKGAGDADEATKDLAVFPPSKSQKIEPRGREVAKGKFSHPWLAASLKAHTGNISGMNFNPSGKYLVSCADDRTIYLWFVKEYLSNTSKFIRVNVEFDHATRICFSPDNRAFLATLYSGSVIRVFKIQRKPEGGILKIEAGFDFPEKDTEEVLCFGMASTGSFVMTCYKTTIMKIWDLKGNLLETINSHQINHTHGAVSPCGRFVACSGFTPEVKVWEVGFSKTGEFKEVAKAFQLGGHSSSVYSFAFNSDSTRMATVSKDGTWSLWDTNIDYKKRQDPKLIQTWSCGFLSGPALIALSPDGLSAAIANGSHVYCYNVHQQDYDKIPDVHPGGASAVEFSPNNLHLATAGQKSIYLFHNIRGIQASIDDLGKKMKSATNSAMKERINEQIAAARNLLKKISESKKSQKNGRSS